MEGTVSGLEEVSMGHMVSGDRLLAESVGVSVMLGFRLEPGLSSEEVSNDTVLCVEGDPDGMEVGPAVGLEPLAVTVLWSPSLDTLLGVPEPMGARLVEMDSAGAVMVGWLTPLVGYVGVLPSSGANLVTGLWALSWMMVVAGLVGTEVGICRPLSETTRELVAFSLGRLTSEAELAWVGAAVESAGALVAVLSLGDEVSCKAPLAVVGVSRVATLVPTLSLTPASVFIWVLFSTTLSESVMPPASIPARTVLLNVAGGTVEIWFGSAELFIMVIAWMSPSWASDGGGSSSSSSSNAEGAGAERIVAGGSGPEQVAAG